MNRPLACLAALIMMLPAAVQAQDRIALGARVGYHFNAEDFSVGAEARVPLSGALAFRPSIDRILVGVGSLTAFNFDLQYVVSRTLYIGGGLGQRQRSVSDVSFGQTGGNLFAGLERAAGKVTMFAEGRAFVEDGVIGYALAGFRVTL